MLVTSAKQCSNKFLSILHLTYNKKFGTKSRQQDIAKHSLFTITVTLSWQEMTSWAYQTISNIYAWIMNSITNLPLWVQLYHKNHLINHSSWFMYCCKLNNSVAPFCNKNWTSYKIINSLISVLSLESITWQLF